MNKEELKKLKKEELIELVLNNKPDPEAQKIKDQRDGLIALLHLIFLENKFKKKQAKKYNEFIKQILK